MTIVLLILLAYGVIGLIMAVPVCFVLAPKHDESDLPIRVRVLLMPGAVVLWPVLLLRWRSS